MTEDCEGGKGKVFRAKINGGAAKRSGQEDKKIGDADRKPGSRAVQRGAEKGRRLPSLASICGVTDGLEEREKAAESMCVWKAE